MNQNTEECLNFIIILYIRYAKREYKLQANEKEGYSTFR